MNRATRGNRGGIELNLVAKQRPVIGSFLKNVSVSNPSVYKQEFTGLSLMNFVHADMYRAGQQRGLRSKESGLALIIYDHISLFVPVWIRKVLRKLNIVYQEIDVVSRGYCFGSASIPNLSKELKFGKLFGICPDSDGRDLKSINIHKRSLHSFDSLSADSGLLSHLRPLSNANPCQYGSESGYPNGSQGRPVREPVGGILYLLLGFAFYAFAFRIVEETNPPMAMRCAAVLVFLVGFACFGQGVNLICR
jgi:hypothetical protein